MKEFIEKLIGRLEEEKEGAKRRNAFDSELSYTRAITIVNQLAEEYNQNINQDLMIVESLPSLYPLQDFDEKAIHRVVERGKYGDGWIEKLLEVKKNCGEDSDCSKCPFGQIEDRCILNEMQIESENNGWIPCIERLPEKNGMYLVTQKRYSLDTRRMIGIETDYVQFSCGEWCRARFLEVIAWQPLPSPYQPKGE